MTPTLYPNQDVLSFNWAYLGRKPKVGDIVVINVNGKEMVKRVTKVDDSPGEASAKRGRRILVRGDNKKMSTDSRHFGPVGMDQIVGKVIYASKLW